MFCFSLLFTGSLYAADDENDASHYVTLIDLVDDEGTDCQQNGGKRTYVKSSHPKRDIDVRIDRYFQDVRQPGRSVVVLQPEQSQALGCNIALGSKQYWHIVSAHYLD